MLDTWGYKILFTTWRQQLRLSKKKSPKVLSIVPVHWTSCQRQHSIRSLIKLIYDFNVAIVSNIGGGQTFQFEKSSRCGRSVLLGLCNFVAACEEPFIPLIEVHAGLDILAFLATAHIQMLAQQWRHAQTLHARSFHGRKTDYLQTWNMNGGINSIDAFNGDNGMFMDAGTKSRRIQGQRDSFLTRNSSHGLISHPCSRLICDFSL